MSQILHTVYYRYPNRYSLNFNGSNQNVSFGGPIMDPNNDFTIEMWINIDANADTNALFTCFTASDDYWIFINATAGSGRGLCIQWDEPGGPAAQFICAGAATVLATDGWKHVAVTRSGNDWKIYIDAVNVKSETVTPGTLTTSNPQFASATGFSIFVPMNMDEVRIWDVARTTTEIKLNMRRNLDPADFANLIGYYRFEEGSGSTIIDTTGNNNGTSANSPAYQVGDKPW